MWKVVTYAVIDTLSNIEMSNKSVSLFLPGVTLINCDGFLFMLQKKSDVKKKYCATG